MSFIGAQQSTVGAPSSSNRATYEATVTRSLARTLQSGAPVAAAAAAPAAAAAAAAPRATMSSASMIRTALPARGGVIRAEQYPQAAAAAGGERARVALVGGYAPSAAGFVVPDPTTYKHPTSRDQFVEQYHGQRGPDMSGLDLNTFRGVSGMTYVFPKLHSEPVLPMNETTWSTGRNARMRSELPSIDGGKPAPDPVRIVPPVWAAPTGNTQRFRQSKLWVNGQYQGDEVLADATDFRPQTPDEVSFTPVISRTETRYDQQPQLGNEPYPVNLRHAAGTMFTHYSQRVYRKSR